jgi:hypothetical protein
MDGAALLRQTKNGGMWATLTCFGEVRSGLKFSLQITILTELHHFRAQVRWLSQISERTCHSAFRSLSNPDRNAEDKALVLFQRLACT